MRMLHGVLFTAGVLSGAMAVRAQGQQPALQGLPVYGVTLSGSLENPAIENHPGKTVMAYDMKILDVNGRWIVDNQLMATSMLPAGIADGSSVPIEKLVEVRFGGQGPIVRAALRSVIFADGKFVGADEQGSFEQFAMKLKAITEAHHSRAPQTLS